MVLADGHVGVQVDYSTTIRTVRYYLRILCWMLDRVVHTSYMVVQLRNLVLPREWPPFGQYRELDHEPSIRIPCQEVLDEYILL